MNANEIHSQFSDTTEEKDVILTYMGNFYVRQKQQQGTPLVTLAWEWK